MEDKIRELLVSAQAGDETAFTEIYKRYYQSVYIKAFQYLKNDADAKDAAQETFFEVNRSLPRLRELDSFYSWLMMITSSKCSTIYRKQKYNTLDIEDSENTKFCKEERVYMDPQKVNHNKFEKDILLEIIDSMTSKQAEIVKMIYFKEMKLTEIAEALNIPLGTVKTRSVKAKQELKSKIKRYEKRENYRLHFHADAILPSALLSISFSQIMLSSVKRIMENSYQFVTQQTAIAVCSASMVGLAVTGGTFVYQDYQASKHPVTPPVKEAEPLPQNTFQSIAYEEDAVKSHREAYYICLNFAQDEEMMKSRSKEEFEELIPIYESMKQANSMYYKSLTTRGWSTLFETYAYLE